MKRFFVLIILVLITGCASSPMIYNIEQEYIPTLTSGEKPSLKNVEGAILAGARRRGWSPRVIKPGLIEARLTVRSHRAVVEITYTDSYYSINYKDSENLNYRNGKIHKNYNNWILKLSSTIQGQFGVRTQNF